MLPLMAGEAFAQKTNRGILNNRISYAVNGIGDRSGPMLQLGYENVLGRWCWQTDFVFASYGSNAFDIENYQQSFTTEHWGLRLIFGRELPVMKFLTIVPKVGITGNLFRNLVLTGVAYIEIGNDYFAPNTGTVYNQGALGYWIDIPFQFKLSKQVQLTLSAQYGNDQVGSSIYAVGTGVRVKLFEKKKG
jgi:hypothetical protein